MMSDAEYNETTALLNELLNWPILTREEEVDLFKRVENGDAQAREEIVRANLRFVAKIAYEFIHRGVPLADLIQEGICGLLEVIPKYEWRRGFRFSTYAAFWIRQAMQIAVRRQCGVIRIPIRKSRLLGRMAEESRQFLMQNGREPTADELAEAMGIDRQEVDTLLRLREGVLSLDATEDEDKTPLVDQLPDDEEKSPREVAGREQLKSKVARVFEYLGEREKRVLRLRFGFDSGRALSLRNTSRVVGLSQEGVRRIEQRALQKLRRPALREMVAGLV